VLVISTLVDQLIQITKFQVLVKYIAASALDQNNQSSPLGQNANTLALQDMLKLVP
jgi:hypothetical protein